MTKEEAERVTETLRKKYSCKKHYLFFIRAIILAAYDAGRYEIEIYLHRPAPPGFSFPQIYETLPVKIISPL